MGSGRGLAAVEVAVPGMDDRGRDSLLHRTLRHRRRARLLDGRLVGADERPHLRGQRHGQLSDGHLRASAARHIRLPDPAGVR